MTLLDDRPDLENPELGAPDLAEHDLTRPEQEEETAGVEEVVLRPTVLTIAGALSALAPAFLIARLFRGGLAPYVSTLLGVGIGAGLTWLSFRSKRTSLVQSLVVPASALVGAVLMTPALKGGSANIPSLVVEALKAGGLRQAPVAFDPGWRLICVVVLAGVTAAAISVAASMSRPQLLALVPLPVTAGAAFIQPKGAEVVSAAVAIVFVIGGLSVAYGAALAGDDDLGGKFEARRLARGAGLIGAVLVLLVLLAQTDFLFPASNRDQVIPPQKPPPPQKIADRVLFTVNSTSTGPWRVGTLDVYQNDAFYLPSIDPKRTRVVPKSGTISHKAGQTYTASFFMTDLPGHQIPTPANPLKVTGAKNQLEYDPRTNLLKVRNTRIPAGMRYTVTAFASPDAKALAAAPAAPRTIQIEFAAVPTAPPGVQALLASLPVGISEFDRVQAVRQALYNKVIAAGSGRPIDIKPTRVDEMLAGGEATPYEITAAEVLLTRWAGVPARIGFGFSGGETAKGVTSFRPRDGAAWLEAYFNGYGFVPIVGTPPRAKASISPDQKKKDPQVVATDELALTIYVPVRRHDIRALFEIVRYWLLVIAPLLAAVIAFVLTAPGFVKELRSRRRRRWALARSPNARIAVAYAEMRDRAFDLNIGGARDTPLEFLNAVADDAEHAELAWLVTRALWGDLARDLQREDVEAAEDMAGSVRRRLVREQPSTNRALAWLSRASLREPYSTEIPNMWRRRGARRAARRAVAVAAAASLAVTGSCAQPRHEAELSTVRFPTPLMPARVGDYTVQAEPKLAKNYATVKNKADVMVQSGRVFTVRTGDVIQGSIQVALFKRDANLIKDKGLRRDVEDGLEAGSAVTHHVGLIQVRDLTLPEQHMYLWFPPDHNVMELFVMRKTFLDAQRVVDSIIQYQRGLPTDAAVGP